MFQPGADWVNHVSTIVIELHDWFLEGCREAVMATVGHMIDKSAEIGENSVFFLKGGQKSV